MPQEGVKLVDTEEVKDHEVVTCNHCGDKDGFKLFPCSSCKSVFYCSPEHQKADWSNHEKLCKEVQKKIEEEKKDMTVKLPGCKMIHRVEGEYVDATRLLSADNETVFRIVHTKKDIPERLCECWCNDSDESKSELFVWEIPIVDMKLLMEPENGTASITSMPFSFNRCDVEDKCSDMTFEFMMNAVRDKEGFIMFGVFFRSKRSEGKDAMTEGSSFRIRSFLGHCSSKNVEMPEFVEATALFPAPYSSNVPPLNYSVQSGIGDADLFGYLDGRILHKIVVKREMAVRGRSVLEGVEVSDLEEEEKEEVDCPRLLLAFQVDHASEFRTEKEYEDEVIRSQVHLLHSAEVKGDTVPVTMRKLSGPDGLQKLAAKVPMTWLHTHME